MTVACKKTGKTTVVLWYLFFKIRQDDKIGSGQTFYPAG